MLAPVAFAINHPEAAAIIAAVLLVTGLVVLRRALHLLRRGWRRILSWSAAPASGDPPRT